MAADVGLEVGEGAAVGIGEVEEEGGVEAGVEGAGLGEASTWMGSSLTVGGTNWYQAAESCGVLPAGIVGWFGRGGGRGEAIGLSH